MANNDKQIKLYVILPTDRYLKKFLATKITLEPEYILSKLDRFGNHLYALLDKEKVGVEFSKIKYNSSIKISIPLAYEKLGKYEFKKDAIVSLNEFINYWFYESFFEHMDLCMMFSIPIDESIFMFCKMKEIEIDIDIQYETLRKRYQRYREKNGQPINKYITEILQEN